MLTLQEIESKLEDLRKLYKDSLFQDRQILIRRARALELAKEKLRK